MKAQDLAQPLPTVTVASSAMEAARLIADERLPGIAVLDEAGRPVGVLPASDVLRAVVPEPVLDDPSLAGVVDEASADRLCSEGLGRKQVRDLMRPRHERVELAQVEPGDTVIECAAVMARLRSPAVVVIDHEIGTGRLLGVITASHLLEVLLNRPA